MVSTHGHAGSRPPTNVIVWCSSSVGSVNGSELKWVDPLSSGVQPFLTTDGMKILFWLVAALGLTFTTAIAQNSANRDDVREGNTCGPPKYCARTDRRVEPFPEKAPTIGPAGSIIKDPSFGSRILRVTGERSDPRHVDGPLYTPASAEQNSWNQNSTIFYVITSGGWFLLYDFDPATMTVRARRDPNLNWDGGPSFSFHQVDLLNGMHRPEPIFEQYNTSNGHVVQVNDPSKCIKLKPGDQGHDLTVNADDSRFMTVLGPRQDESDLVYIYDRRQGCRWYNTQTGQVGGQWGPKGTISLPDRFFLHNARMTKSGKFVQLVRAGGSPAVGHRWLVWEIDSMKISVCPDGCSGHHALGYSHVLSPSGKTHPLDLWLRPLDHLEQSISLISGLESGEKEWYDSHLSWNNADPDDTVPVCFSTYLDSNPPTPNAPLSVTGPWENEIDCAETDGKGSMVWRFAHTYSTAKNGFWSSPRGNVSQDGRFFMFTSDWQDQLGKIPNGDQYRTDVFIVELR